MTSTTTHPTIMGARVGALVAATLIAAALACGLGALAATSVAHAEGPGEGSPWVASLGDSYISGEAGRWAGNTNESSSHIDALGSTAYFDNASHTAELIPACHRSASAEVYIGGGVNGENLACSGAKTSSFTTEGKFKPGIDFYNSGGNEGQALMLQHFAASHNVKLVALSIGGNNFNFASIVQTCILDWLTSPSWWPNFCYDDFLGAGKLHDRERRHAEGRHQGRDPERRAGDDECRLLELAVHDPRPGLPLADP